MESHQNIDQEAPDIHSECVKEEFYKWFESRGMLSELRAYMRQLMVKALEESNKNSKTSVTRKAATSPKLQAINLLLVDYLFHEDYLYTVSVFASEAQILESLPQYSRYVTETVRQRRWDPSCLPRFSRQETEDILDTLRLPPSRQDMRQASQLYLSGEESLLTCVARTLASSQTFSPVSSARVDYTEAEDLPSAAQCCYQLWSQEMQNLLLMAGVKLQHIRRMQQKWERIIEEEKLKARKQCEKEQLAQRGEWEQRLQEEMAEDMGEEQKRLDQRERELNSLAVQLSEVHQDISQRLAELQEQSEGVQDRDMHQQRERDLLERRFSDIQVREERLELTMASLKERAAEITSHQVEVSAQPQRDVTMTSDASVQVCDSQEPAVRPGPQERPSPVPGPQVASTHTQTADTVDHQQQTSSATEPDPQLLLQLQTEREKINELQEENLELRAHTLQQRQRIDELTNRAASLSNQLEESQVALTLLDTREGVPHPPLPSPIPALPPSRGGFIAPIYSFNCPQRIGAGEESLFSPRQQQATPRPDSRRRPTRFVFSNNPNPTSEESSPTDEVVENARARIQQLEAESVAVQRSYHALQTRLLNSDSVMFPPLGGPPRTADPLLRVRRNDMMPFVPLSTHHPPFHSNNYRQPARNVQSPEEEDDSSSDQALFYSSDRFNARRMYTQRNIRHFERWKQFKKKFQRRNDFDQNRQNNTSSDDEADNLKKPRKRCESNKTNNAQKSHTLNTQEQNQWDRFSINGTESKENQHKLAGNKNQSDHTNLPILTITKEDSQVKGKVVTPLGNKTKEEKIKLEVEQSMKLIESVKILLESQHLMNPPSLGKLSNGSLAVESLPRDSDDTSALTVKIVGPVVQEETEEKGSEMESTLKPCTSNNTANICQSQEYLGQDVSTIHLKDPEIENRALALNIPTPRFDSPGLNAASENRIGTEPITSSEVAEQESADRGTTSVTSASDILRELNPSKDSSDSVMSTGTGLANDSHSEDFWN